jgi:hypothetical protein
MPRVRIPEVQVGPPLTRWKRERIVNVSAREAEVLVAEQGAEILEDEPKPKAEPKPKDEPKPEPKAKD